MTNRELIIMLLEHPLDAEIVRRAGEDPHANLPVQQVEMGETYVPPDTIGRKRVRRTLIIQ